MQVAYEPWLVLLSIVMAIQGAYVGLSLSVQISAAAGMRRRLLLAGAAFSLAEWWSLRPKRDQLRRPELDGLVQSRRKR